jgi:plastocyanin
MRHPVIALIVFALAACSKGTTTSTTSTPPSTPPSTAAPSGSSCTDAAGGGTVTDKGTESVSGSEFELEADDEDGEFYFKPTCLKGSGTVELEVKNEGSVEHNFSVTSMGIDSDVEAGETVKVSVTFPAQGATPFFCKYHAGRGMKGALIAA